MGGGKKTPHRRHPAKRGGELCLPERLAARGGGEARQIQPTASRQDPKGVRRRGDDTLSRVTGQKRREKARRAASAD